MYLACLTNASMCRACLQLILIVTSVGISHYYIIVDDVIIIMLTISDEGWKVRLSRLDALFHSSHLRSEFRVLCLLTSVPNRVWNFYGLPLVLPT